MTFSKTLKYVAALALVSESMCVYLNPKLDRLGVVMQVLAERECVVGQLNTRSMCTMDRTKAKGHNDSRRRKKITD